MGKWWKWLNCEACHDGKVKRMGNGPDAPVDLMCWRLWVAMAGLGGCRRFVDGLSFLTDCAGYSARPSHFFLRKRSDQEKHEHQPIRGATDRTGIVVDTLDSTLHKKPSDGVISAVLLVSR
jgi:hypothetical protein